jgi:hypothetical protein
VVREPWALFDLCRRSGRSERNVVLYRPSVVVVTGDSYLAPTLWTPDDVLIASDFGHHKTYSVATSGMATLINSTYAAQTSVG